MLCIILDLACQILFLQVFLNRFAIELAIVGRFLDSFFVCDEGRLERVLLLMLPLLLLSLLVDFVVAVLGPFVVSVTD